MSDAHEVVARVEGIVKAEHVAEDGTRVIDEVDPTGVTFHCTACSFQTTDLTEVAQHVVLSQFTVR